MTPTTDGQGTAPRNRLSKAELAALAPTRSAHREVQTGLFVLAGAIAVVIALFLLTDPGTFRGRYYVSTVVEDAGGIRKGDPVQLRGVNVGRVRSFEIVPGGVGVRLELEKEYEIPSDSRVVLRSAGLLGGLVADIVPGTSEEPLENGDELPASSGTPGLEDVAGDLSEQAGGVLSQADAVMTQARALLSDETVGAVGNSTERLESLLTELDALATEQRGEVRALTASLRRSAAGVEAATTQEELATAIARTDSITRQLDVAAASLTEASASLAVVMERIENGEGTLGRLTTDESLYDNLNATAVELRTLAQDIRENPRRYINVSVF